MPQIRVPLFRRVNNSPEEEYLHPGWWLPPVGARLVIYPQQPPSVFRDWLSKTEGLFLYGSGFSAEAITL